MLGRQKVNGELRKIPEDLEYIDMVNGFISDEYSKLGIKGSEKLLPEQVHFLKEVTFISKFERNSSGLHDAFPDAIFINDGMLSRYYRNCYKAKVCETLLHEAIHKSSFTKYHLDYDEDIQHSQYSTSRYGYVVENSQEDEHRHFWGFNEAVIQRMTLEIIENNKEKISKLFGISEREWEIMFVPYQSQIKVLDYVVSGVAEYFNENEEEFWSEIKRGLFTGKLLHLRKIEKCFGKGSLRVLAAMDCGTRIPRQGTPPQKIRQFREGINDKILEYFNTKDEYESERNRLAHEILNERERLNYIMAKK